MTDDEFDAALQENAVWDRREMVARKAAFDRGEMNAVESEEFVGAYKEYVKECAKEREVKTFSDTFTTTDLSANADRESMTYEQFCSIKREHGTRAQRVSAEHKVEIKPGSPYIVSTPTLNEGGWLKIGPEDDEVVWVVSDGTEWRIFPHKPEPAPEIPENAKDNPALFDALNNIEPNPEHGMRSNLSKWS